MPDRTATPVLAADVRTVVGALVRRFRQDRTIPQPQVAALSWLVRKGPKTTSQLAALERVRPQSMASTVAQLEDAAFIERRPHPTDGRQTLIDLTDAGRDVMNAYFQAGESWVAEAIDAQLSVAERAELARGLELLGRLVDD